MNDLVAPESIKAGEELTSPVLGVWILTLILRDQGVGFGTGVRFFESLLLV